RVRALSDRLVEAQRPIRILDAVKWDDNIERAFFAHGTRALPPVTRESYRPLPYDPDRKLQELDSIEHDIRTTLGEADAPGRIMARMCREYRDVVHMLRQRGTPAFAWISRQLYGSATDRLPTVDPSLADLRSSLSGLLGKLSHDGNGCRPPETIDARQAVAALSSRLAEYFQDPAVVRVKLSDGIVADAAAGSDYVKIRGDATFTPRDLRVLEVHEGWVHLGTTFNGQEQPVCTFLGKGPPSSTITQEGLAVLVEILTFAGHPARVRRLLHRIQAVALAESGADFLDVYRYFLDQGYEPRSSYQHTMRVFRGSLPAGCGPFSKDLCYSKGFVLVYDFIRRAVRQGMLLSAPLLFCGKTTVGDMTSLA